MRRSIATIGAVTLLTCALSTPALGASKLHPRFPVLDAAGEHIQSSGQPPDSAATCGKCHDAFYIDAHSSHVNSARQADCFDCHVEDVAAWSAEAFDEDGLLRREVVGVGSATSERCGRCHGLVVLPGEPVSLPEDYASVRQLDIKGFRYGLSVTTGTIYSGQPVSKSYVNLENKGELSFPWDVHAERLVGCPACHAAANNPAQAQTGRGKLSYIGRDPRTPTISAYLEHPDHRLTNASCLSCHEPTAAHDFLPHQRRHFEALACQSCHVPQVFAPSLAWQDATVVDLRGEPLREYRGFETTNEPLGSAFGHGHAPFLVPWETADGNRKVGPFNPVARFFWVDEQGAQVPQETVRRAYTNDGQYWPEVLALLDKDGDKVLHADELVLRDTAAVQLIASRMAALGVVGPRIRGLVDAFPVVHGVTRGRGVTKKCGECHATGSRLTGDITIAARLPGGVAPEIGPRLKTWRGGRVEASGASIRWTRDAETSDLYVFGHTRVSWSDRTGLFLFALAFLGVLSHGSYRFYTRKRRSPHAVRTERKYLYSAYERIWHWLMAAGVLALLVTGFQIHYPAQLHLMAFDAAVTLHDVLAVVMVANAFLSFFYHLASSAILQFVPDRRGLMPSLLAQVRYYTQGIFLGQPHPTAKTAQRKLNPLQQLTYLTLLNILLPLQVTTGVLIWTGSRWPEALAAVGGLSIIGPLHNLGSWLLLTFFVVHLYLITTGHTLTSNLAAMIDGYDEVEVPSSGTTADGGSRA